MKKRTIIAIILTIIVVMYIGWLRFNPIHISMDISGTGTCRIKTLLNRRNNDTFTRVHSDQITANPSENTHADFYVKGLKLPKRVRFVIDNLNNCNELIISNIRIDNKQFDNLDKFDIQGATATINNNKLILKPNDTYIVITYPYKLKIIASIDIDWQIIIIIIVLAYLLIYKLTNYVTEFKTLKNKSRIEILF